jgi:hypothetical protein
VEKQGRATAGEGSFFTFSDIFDAIFPNVSSWLAVFSSVILLTLLTEATLRE